MGVTKKETTYQAIKRLELEVHYLMLKGLVPCHVVKWKGIYEHYLKIKDEHKTKTSAILDVSIRHNVSEKTVERVIKFMNE